MEAACLVAIDGHSLNYNLRKKAYNLQQRGSDLPENFGKPRLRLDYLKLAELLSDPFSPSEVTLRYYTDQKSPALSDREMGKVVSYKPDEGVGYIAGARGGRYVFHISDVSGRFSDKLYKQVVTFEVDDDDENRAVALAKVGTNQVDKYYRLRRESYFEMLDESGYEVIRCRPSRNPQHKGKAKSVDCRIYYDAMDFLSEEDDQLVLLSDDPNFGHLIEGLSGYGVKIVLVTFDTAASKELREITLATGGEVLLLDRHLDEVQLEPEAAHSGQE